MFLAIPIFILMAAAMAADWYHFHRFRRRRPIPAGRIVWAVVTDLLPLAAILIGTLSRDNTTAVVQASMWLLWAWLFTVLPRLARYPFRLIGWRRAGNIAAALIAVTLLWGATLGRTSLRVSRVEICSERLPAAFDGMRLVQISDLHLGTIVSPERELGRLADRINALRPDLVLFTGDLVNIRAAELDERMARLLQRIEAPVYSVTGNHDVGTYIKDSLHHTIADNLRSLIDRQEAMGWHVLDNRTCYIRRGGDSISLTGLSFDPALRWLRHNRHLPATGMDKAYGGVPRETFNITLAHVPQLWEQITAAGYGDLTLSGHVHAMQLKIRFSGRGWSPASWLYEHWSGRYDNDDGRTLYINDGTGYVGYPMRLGARPEITLLTLKRCE